MKKTKFLAMLLAAFALSTSAMAQEIVPEGIDSVVTYIRNGEGNMVVDSRTVYQRNDAGEVVSQLTHNIIEGVETPYELVKFINEDVNNDGTLDEVQESRYWDFETHDWGRGSKRVNLNFNSNMKYELQEYYSTEDGWELVGRTETLLSDGGKTVEVVRHDQEYETNIVVPSQKQVIKTRTSVFDLMKLFPDMPLEMIVHRYLEHYYTLSERYYYDSEKKDWILEEYRTKQFDENGMEIASESRYYMSYPTWTMYSGQKTEYTETEDGYRTDNYTYNNDEWQLESYVIVAKAGNRVTISQYTIMNGKETLDNRSVETLDEQGRATETIEFDAEGNPHYRHEFAYDEQGNVTESKTYSREGGAWKCTGLQQYEFDKVGHTTLEAYAYSDNNGWSYGYKNTTQYTTDGNILMTHSYGLDIEQSAGEELVWNLNRKYCNFYHHDDAQTATVEAVTVTPTGDAAEFTWPTVENASIYNLYLYLHGNLFQYYMFDATGRLLGIQYAPAQNRADSPAPQYAAEASNGWQFTIPNLECGEQYTYTFTAEDEAGAELQNITGTFQTPDPTAIRGMHTRQSATIRNLQGQPVGPEYKGIVIVDGKKVMKF